MENFRTIEIKESIFEDNNKDAEKLRGELKKDNTFLLNLMSSPGSGKTTFLKAVLPILKERGWKIGVMEADIDSDVDARAISELGIKTIQLHTGGMCHLDADMTRQGLKALGTEDLDIVILENVGNLVCPAEFDTGSIKNMMLLSVPEGDDKPLKYPLMFSIVSLVLVTKYDVIPYFEFSLEKVEQRVKRLNPEAKVYPVSARKGEGLEPFISWLEEEVEKWRSR